MGARKNSGQPDMQTEDFRAKKLAEMETGGKRGLTENARTLRIHRRHFGGVRTFREDAWEKGLPRHSSLHRAQDCWDVNPTAGVGGDRWWEGASRVGRRPEAKESGKI